MDQRPAFNPHDYTRVKKLGQGSYGVCWLVVDQQGRYFALKDLSFPMGCSAEEEKARAESRLLQTLDHPHIVKGYGCVCSQRRMSILMQYCDGGDLGKLINHHARARLMFREEQIMTWTAQLASAIWYMHSRRIMHRDIKTANIFLNSDKTLFVGDLGTGRNVTRNSLVQTYIGTPLYMSPELLDHLPYSYPADMWAVGCVIVEMAILRVSFDARDIAELHMRVLSGRIPELPTMYSNGLRDICKRLLAQDPNTRLTAAELCMHPALQPYIRKLNLPSPAQRDIEFSKTLVTDSADAEIYRTYRPPNAGDLETELTRFIYENTQYSIDRIRGQQDVRKEKRAPPQVPAPQQPVEEMIGVAQARGAAQPLIQAPIIPDKTFEDEASNLARTILEARLQEEVGDPVLAFRLKNAVKTSYTTGMPTLVAAAANIDLPPQFRSQKGGRESWHQNSAEAWNQESAFLEYIFTKLLPDKAVGFRALKICRQLAINEALN